MRPIVRGTWHRRVATLVATLAAAILLAPTRPRADGPRFAIVNLSGPAAPEGLVAEIEREIARLRPGSRAIEDQPMRKLLASGESASDTVQRLLGAAELALAAGNCALAIPLATEAEELALAEVGLNEERDLLKRIYITLVSCEDAIGRKPDRAARNLRGLLSLPPDGLAPELWQRLVENALPPAGGPTSELYVDSEPANAQVAINLHGDGVTPRTLQVPRGEVLVEVEKEGYKKAFRRLQVGDAPARTVFRLIERGRDRLELALAALQLVSSDDPRARPRSLSQLAQWSRADSVVCVKVSGDRVRLWQFDAERGAFAQEVIDSPFDPSSFKVATLATRATPRTGPARAGALAPVGADGTPRPRKDNDRPDGKATRADPDAAHAGDLDAGLPSTFKEPKAKRPFTFARTKAPWWGWLIAAAVAGSIAVIVIRDQPITGNTLDINARYEPRF